MGMATRIYGCIEEYGLSKGKDQSIIYHHNRRVIQNLPVTDNWPPLTRNMFSITHSNPTGPSYDYMGRLIHFGANFKSIEHEWAEWKDKFEHLLTRLYWLSADVHVKTEYDEAHHFSWIVDLSKWDKTSNNDINYSPITKGDWEYFGTPTWYSN